MSISLALMYLVTVAIGVASYAVSRGPDGQFTGFFISFAIIAVLYTALAWITRHQPIWPHLGIHFVLYLIAAWFGMRPKPHLDEMAGYLYLFVPVAIVGTVALGSVARSLSRWW